MQSSIFSHLPDEIIQHILLYDRRFIWREKRWITITQFSKKDERYALLQKIPKKWNLSENSWSVIICLKNKKRFVLGYQKGLDDLWQYFFSVFIYDHLLSILKQSADMTISYTLL